MSLRIRYSRTPSTTQIISLVRSNDRSLSKVHTRRTPTISPSTLSSRSGSSRSSLPFKSTIKEEYPVTFSLSMVNHFARWNSITLGQRVSDRETISIACCTLSKDICFDTHSELPQASLYSDPLKQSSQKFQLLNNLWQRSQRTLSSS